MRQQHYLLVKTGS